MAETKIDLIALHVSSDIIRRMQALVRASAANAALFESLVNALKAKSSWKSEPPQWIN